MDRISFPYRASSHLVLLHVVAESGAWEKHGLDVTLTNLARFSDELNGLSSELRAMLAENRPAELLAYRTGALAAVEQHPVGDVLPRQAQTVTQSRTAGSARRSFSSQR